MSALHTAADRAPVRGSSSRSSAYSSPPACSCQRLSRVERREDRLEHLTATEGLRNGQHPGPELRTLYDLLREQA
jgi:hypothetical protein